MGGLRIVPSRRIADVHPDDVAVCILPGGERWERVPMELELESVLKCLDERQIPIAAICAATVAVARVGLLRGRRHTSNGLSYSASGLADVEFARELFEELGVLWQGDRALWAEMFRTARLPGSQT